MDSNEQFPSAADSVITLQQLAAKLGVTVQTLYDLRSQGRGPTDSGSAGSCASAPPRSKRGSPARGRGPHPPPPGRAPMTGGRPRTAIGTYGTISIRVRGGRFVAETRFRDLDGRLRKVNATASRSVARASLKERLLVRPGHGSGGLLSLASPFGDLVELWLADLEVRDLTEGTRDYRDDLRLHITPVFGAYTLGEITTGRVEWFLRREAAVSYSRAKHSRTLLKLLFGFALRHDAIPRDPVEGTSPLKKPNPEPRALTLEQIAAIRAAAAVWRTGPGEGTEAEPAGVGRHRGPPRISAPDGEALALRVRDLEDPRRAWSCTSAAPSCCATATAPSGRTTRRPSIPCAHRAARVRRGGAAAADAALGPGDPDRTVFTTGPGVRSARSTCAAPSASSSRSPVLPSPGSRCAGTGGPARR